MSQPEKENFLSFPGLSLLEDLIEKEQEKQILQEASVCRNTST